MEFSEKSDDHLGRDLSAIITTPDTPQGEPGQTITFYENESFANPLSKSHHQKRTISLGGKMDSLLTPKNIK